MFISFYACMTLMMMLMIFDLMISLQYCIALSLFFPNLHFCVLIIPSPVLDIKLCIACHSTLYPLAV
jgi:hypothetical protein